MKKILYTLYILVALAITACSKYADVPANYSQSNDKVDIYPDYQGVTVPCNIAPLHFCVNNEADEYVIQFESGDCNIAVPGPDACPEADDWHHLVQAGNDIHVSIYLNNQGAWSRLKPFDIHVSQDSIDPYISYRIIAPSYVAYEDLTIRQRNLENYDESVIYSNMANTTEKDGQCINCHSYQNYDPNRMQFHVRQSLGGTIIAYDGKIDKVNPRHILDITSSNDTIASGCVYPSWHPTAKLIAYSSNHTGQSFHTQNLNKVEVQDTYSDLVLYDVDNDKVIDIECDTTELNCFPWWSPDGKYLYYCSAHYEKHDTVVAVTKEFDLIKNYKDAKYSIYRRSFNLNKMRFGKREMVYDAAADSMSATLPRISPDGRYLMFTLGKYGVFHIWHKDADLYMMDLKNGKTRAMKELNSNDVESYHNWSSNGRWVIFSSRRTDGNFTRPFIAHIDKNGRASKPFELPQDNPNYHHELIRSYNIPEFMKGPVTIRPQEFTKVVREQ